MKSKSFNCLSCAKAVILAGYRWAMTDILLLNRAGSDEASLLVQPDEGADELRSADKYVYTGMQIW